MPFPAVLRPARTEEVSTVYLLQDTLDLSPPWPHTILMLFKFPEASFLLKFPLRPYLNFAKSTHPPRYRSNHSSHPQWSVFSQLISGNTDGRSAILHASTPPHLFITAKAAMAFPSCTATALLFPILLLVIFYFPVFITV